MRKQMWNRMVRLSLVCKLEILVLLLEYYQSIALMSLCWSIITCLSKHFTRTSVPNSIFFYSLALITISSIVYTTFMIGFLMATLTHFNHVSFPPHCCTKVWLLSKNTHHRTSTTLSCHYDTKNLKYRCHSFVDYLLHQS